MHYRIKGLVLALLLAPLTAIPIYIIVIGIEEPNRFLQNMRYIGVVAIASYMITIAVGLPIHYISQWKTKDKLWYYYAIGFLLPLPLTLGELVSGGDTSGKLVIGLMFSLCGATVATSFRYIIGKYKSIVNI